MAINHRGELLNVALTAGNIDDRKPVRELLKEQNGQFFGDKGVLDSSKLSWIQYINTTTLTIQVSATLPA